MILPALTTPSGPVTVGSMVASTIVEAPSAMSSALNGLAGTSGGLQGGFSARGTTASQNTLYLNGVNVGDPAAIGFAGFYYDFDSLDDVQVSTGAHDITVPTGGVFLNMVTKSGGNKWQGSTTLTWLSDNTQARNDTGIGSDGLILICASERADARMRMFNADGSESEMCGNGLRCVAKFVYDHGIARKPKLAIETGRGVLTVDLEVKQDKVSRVRVNARERLMLTQMEPNLGKRLQVRFADRPEGPWSDGVAIHTCPEPAEDSRSFVYSGKAHPEISGEGEMVMTYCVNSTDFWYVVGHVSLYRPRVLRIPWSTLEEASPRMRGGAEK